MEERIQKIIAAAGIMSRRAAEQLILDGRVRVNGKVVTEMGVKADPDKDHIKVDGKLINPKQPPTYVMLNKPAGYVTTMSDPEGRQTVSDLLKGIKVRVYPVGRLDYDTEGLLLLTNDGDFAHLVTHPSHELPKTYLAKVKGVLTDRDVENLEEGVFLQDGKTAPARVRKLRKEETNSWVEITIHEGRKRQVRRMIDHTGHSVIKLKRTRVGNLELGDLALGTYRYLTADEVKALRDTAQGVAGAPAGEVVRPARKPAAAGYVPEFIEGPKPGRKKEEAGSPRGKAPERMSARPAEGRRKTYEQKPFPAGQRTGRSGGGKERSFDTRGTRPGSGFRSREEGGDRRFGKQTFGAAGYGQRTTRTRSEDRSSTRPGSGYRPREEGGARRFGKTTAGGPEYGRRSMNPPGKDRQRQQGSEERTIESRGRKTGSVYRAPGEGARHEQRGSRSFGERTSRGEKRFDRPSFGGSDRTVRSSRQREGGYQPRERQERSVGARGPRTGGGFRRTEGAGQGFESRGPRSSGTGSSRGARPFGKSSFGGPKGPAAGRAPRREGGYAPRRSDEGERRQPWSGGKGTDRPAFKAGGFRSSGRSGTGGSARKTGARPGGSRFGKSPGKGRGRRQE